MPSLFSKPSKKSAGTRRSVLKKKSKLSLKFIAPALAMVITLAGAGIATMLAQKSQENRGQAAGCNPNVDQPRCSDNDGHWWTCQDPGEKGNWSYQKGGVCNESIANPSPADTSSFNADGTCKEGKEICRNEKLQYCKDNNWITTERHCGINYSIGSSCEIGAVQCNDSQYFVCECNGSYLGNSTANCSWQRVTARDADCNSDFYGQGAGGGSGSSQGGASQPTPPANTDPVGYLDEVTCSQAIGWACDGDVETKIDVHFYSGFSLDWNTMKFIGSAKAELAGGNTDYNAIAAMGGCNGNGARRFNFQLPPELTQTGNSGVKIYAFALNRDKDGNGGGNNPLLINAPRPTCQSTRTMPNVTPTKTCNADNTVTVAWKLTENMDKFILRMDKANASNCNGTEWYCGDGAFNGDQYAIVKTTEVCDKDGNCSVTRPIVTGALYNGITLQWVAQNGTTQADGSRMGKTESFTCGSPRAKILGIF